MTDLEVNEFTEGGRHFLWAIHNGQRFDAVVERFSHGWPPGAIDAARAEIRRAAVASPSPAPAIGEWDRTPKYCAHGVGFSRLVDGSPARCPDCNLVWHEERMRIARAEVVRHQHICNELIAEISRTCGDS